MLSEFKIAETQTFQKKINQNEFQFLYPKIKDYVYSILRKNPFFQPNIKKLKSEWKNFYRFRVGNYRLFYSIEEKQVIVYMIDIQHRKLTYKK